VTPGCSIIFAEGYRSFGRGHKLGANPYRQSWMRAQWRAGWIEAWVAEVEADPSGIGHPA